MGEAALPASRAGIDGRVIPLVYRGHPSETVKPLPPVGSHPRVSKRAVHVEARE